MRATCIQTFGPCGLSEQRQIISCYLQKPMEDGPPDLIIGINLYRQEENVGFYILPVPDSLWISAMTGRNHLFFSF